jgi:hypothetical protein
MSGLLDSFAQPDLSAILPRGGSMPPSFGDIWGAARQQSDVLDRSDSYDLYAKQLAQPVVDALRSRGRTSIDTGYGRRIAITPRNFARDREAIADRIWQEVAAERERDPGFLQDYPDRDAFDNAVLARRKRDLVDAESVLASGSGAATVVGELGGAIQSTLADPVTWITTGLTLPFGGPVSGGIARQIGISALREAALNTAATVPALAFKDRNMEELGREYGLGDAALDLGLAALVGGGLGATAAAGGVALDKGVEAMSARRLARELEALPDTRGMPLTATELAAVKVLKRQADDLDTSPFAPDPHADAAHLQRLHETEDALLTDDPLPGPAGMEPPLSPAAIDAQLPGNYRILSAKDLQTDPETFQYKAGGDGQGVTDRLRGVTEWNADAAGAIMVWERADGTLFVADGHQRSGLARRLIGEGRYEDIGLLSHVYREADGVTAETAMLRAAGANILAGTGTPTDAARIIRRAGIDSAHLKGFNKASAFGQQSMGLARLSDDAFGMVINGDDETMIIGAIVGRVAPDAPELHAQMIQALRTADVSSAAQRELMLRDMLAAPRSREHQTDMFGVLEVTRSLYAERARILERALESVRRAKRALVSAADNADTLAEAGARIDRGRAAAVAEQNAQLADVIERLARVTDNPVNTALSRAAVSMSEGKRADAAARDFLAGLRSQPDLVDELVGRGRPARDAAGDAGLAGRAGTGDAAESGAGAVGADAGRLSDPDNPVFPGTGKSIEDARLEAEALLQAHPPRTEGGAPGTHNIRNADAAGDGSGRTRGDLRLAIVEDLLARPAAKGREAHIVLGPPAAGKSSLAEPLAKARSARIVDSDDAKAKLPEYRDGIGAVAVHEESADLARVAERHSVEAGDNIVLPVVGRTYAQLENRIDALVKQNYSVYVHFVDLPGDEAVRRAKARYAATGRLVDPDYVASIGDAPSRNFQRLLDERGGDLKGYLHVSNAVPEGNAPSLVRTSDEGLYRPVGDRRPGAQPDAADLRAEPQRIGEGDAGEDLLRRLTADAASGRTIDEFDDPYGAGAAAQADNLLHDMRGELEAGGEPDGETGGLFALFDGDEADPRADLADIDADAAAFKAVEGCLKDPGGAA